MRKEIYAVLEAGSPKEAKPFDYKGYTIYPLKSFSRSDRKYAWDNFGDLSGKPLFKADGGYDYKEFYAEAKKAGADKYDLFGFNGDVVIPTNGGLVRWTDNEAKETLTKMEKEYKTNKEINKDLEDVWNKREYKS